VSAAFMLLVWRPCGRPCGAEARVETVGWTDALVQRTEFTYRTDPVYLENPDASDG
jgi:hypothetical protein